MGGFVNDVVSIGTFGLVDDVTGMEAAQDAALQSAATQAAAGERAIEEQRRASAQALGFLEPFQAVGEQALPQAGILTDPQQQFEFLQNNPLFNLALENANRQTMQKAAATGRISAGDTLQQLSNNVLLSAQPILGQQQQNVAGLLDFGRGLATTQANTALGQGSNVSNLLTDIGAARAAGQVGAANAAAQTTQSILGLGGTLGGAALMAGPGSIGAGLLG